MGLNGTEDLVIPDESWEKIGILMENASRFWPAAFGERPGNIHTSWTSYKNKDWAQWCFVWSCQFLRYFLPPKYLDHWLKWGNLKLMKNEQTIRSMWVESGWKRKELTRSATCIAFTNPDRKSSELHTYFGVVQFYLTCRFKDDFFQLAYVTVADDLRGEVERANLSCRFSDEMPGYNRFIDIGTIKGLISIFPIDEQLLEASAEFEGEEDDMEEWSSQFDEDWEDTRQTVRQQRYGIAWKHMTLLADWEPVDD
ncbi:hypothetical protein BT69DRAFT_1341976 [Atractiella rhizophila]|nr:hypothetical protein BT69DRAFT_1341976 [Atractiella rhizophila]